MAAFDKPGDDALVGLWFEMGGGLGRMTGQIVGKANQLYVVRRESCEHLELMDIDDLRAARFYKAANQMRAKTGPVGVALSGVTTVAPETSVTPTPPPQPAEEREVPAIETPGVGPAPVAAASEDDEAKPARRTLGEQIRRAAKSRAEQA